MFSMTKRQWLAQFFRPVFSGPRHQREKREKAVKIRYEFRIPVHGTFAVLAHTKGEARSQVRRLLRVSRLPVGTVCVDQQAA